MVNAYYICNGCGLYTSYKGKNETQLNVIEVDLTNYLLFNSGFKLKEPRLDIHLCDPCYAKVLDGTVRVQSFGEIETMRKKIEELEGTLKNREENHARFRGDVARLLSQAKPKESP